MTPRARHGLPSRLAHVAGFDDCPFERSYRGDVTVIGTVYSRDRLDGVMSTRVRRDGANATHRLVGSLQRSKYMAQLHAVLLQGIAFAGFNVVDLERLHAETRLPVLVVARRRPDLGRIRRALVGSVPGGARKWRLIEAAGPMEPMAGVWVQRRGLTPAAAQRLLTGLQHNGLMPEPLRVAHLIAGGVARGESRHRA